MGRPPVYCDIADDVRAMILRRELIDGTALADDEHLAINYRVSSMTVRRAMVILRAENLVERDCGRWIVRQAEPITRLYRVLDALDVGDQPDPDDVRTLAGMVVGLWGQRRAPYRPADASTVTDSRPRPAATPLASTT